MIDTLWLRSQKYELSSSPDLDVREPRVNLRTGEVGRGFILNMGGAAHEIGEAHRNVFDDSGRASWAYDVGPDGVLVRLHSLPRLHDGGVEPVTEPQARSILERTEADLDARGVKVSLMNAEPCRADLFRNAKLRYSFSQFYLPLLSECFVQGERAMESSEFHGETFTLGNRERSIIFYDKSKQWEEVYHKGLPPNTMRAEYKLLKKRPLATALHVSKTSDILSQWHTLPEFYVGEMKKRIFSRAPKLSLEVYKDLSRDLETLKHCRRVFSGRQSWQKTIQRYGYAYYASRYTASQFFELVEPLWGRFVARRASYEVSRVRKELHLFDKQNYVDLYNELKTLLLGGIDDSHRNLLFSSPGH